MCRSQNGLMMMAKASCGDRETPRTGSHCVALLPNVTQTQTHQRERHTPKMQLIGVEFSRCGRAHLLQRSRSELLFDITDCNLVLPWTTSHLCSPQIEVDFRARISTKRGCVTARRSIIERVLKWPVRAATLRSRAEQSSTCVAPLEHLGSSVN